MKIWGKSTNHLVSIHRGGCKSIDVLYTLFYIIHYLYFASDGEIYYCRRIDKFNLNSAEWSERIE